MHSSLPETQADDRNAAQATKSAGNVLRLSGLASFLFLLLAATGAIQTPTVWPLWLTSRQVFQQDTWLALALLGAAGLAFAGSYLKLRPLELSKSVLILAAIAVFALCYAGHYLVLSGFDLTRDEQMVTFDAWVFRHGALAWPLPQVWRTEVTALNNLFMLPIEQPVAWVSAYLPGNALLHAAFGSLGDQALTAPLLTALSVPLLWSIARKLWPDDRAAATIPVILFLTSGQVLLSGMTTFSMAAHLCCNLAWLRLFLADRRAADGAALALGWFATGLHQPLFHPLFVAPFLLILLLERRWTRLACYTAGYAVIGLFWLSWPGQMLGLVSGPESSVLTSGTDYLTRFLAAVSTNVGHLPLLGANLLRFLTWQNVALLPLLFAAWPTIRRNRLAGAMALGLVLPIAVLTAILPWQGNGFGYRYLHPALGNALMLAGYGWQRLAPLHARLHPAFVAASAATVLIILPLQMAMSHARYAPFVRAEATIAASGADYALIQMGNGVAYGDRIINRPDLSNRPIRLVAEYIRDPARLAARICTPGTTVALGTNAFFRPGSAMFGISPHDTADARLPALRAPYEAAGCRVVLLR